MTGNELRRELKKIGDRNRRFNKMTPERKRITIAKDTIAALKTKKIIAETGEYLGSSYRLNGDKLPNNYRCSACALGSMFVGLTTRVKDLSVKKPEAVLSALHIELKPYFSRIQLYAIEAAFEYRRIMHTYIIGSALATCCHLFGSSYPDDDERLVAIMQNIIDNNGEFKP